MSLIYSKTFMRRLAISFVVVTLGFTGAGFVYAGQNKVDVCHMEENGSYRHIVISESAMAAHINHGDAIPGDLAPGDEDLRFSDDCSLEFDSVEGFTKRSLHGTYAAFSTTLGGAPIESAGVGLVHMDGKGKFKSKAMINVPDHDYPDERVIRTVESEGYYKVNPDGMGYFVGLNPREGDLNDIFVITETEKDKKRGKLANELFVIFGNTGTSGTLVAFILKRLP